MITNDMKYNKIKLVQFGCGTKGELDTLAKMECPEELAIVVLTTDTDDLYIITNDGCSIVEGACRRLIQGGMFPRITGNIEPEFKIMRIDVPTMLGSAALRQKKEESDA